MKTDETKLHAAVIATLAEAIAVGLFLAMGFVWMAIYATR